MLSQKQKEKHKKEVREKRKARLLKANKCPQCGKNKLKKNYKRCSVCREKSRLRRFELRMEILTHYGLECNCCGEKNITFLTIDHINNDGAAHRKKVLHLYPWLKRNNYPSEFQTLCWNCQLGKHFNGGICPHQLGRVNA